MKRFFGFIGISGIGWLMDMAIYSLLTMAAGLPVALANCLSSFAAISFVFFTSLRKTFRLNKGGLSLRKKYLLYLLYQLLLVTAVSFLASWIAGWLPELGLKLDGNPVLSDDGLGAAPFWFSLARRYGKIAAKIIITPITMICNYFVLGWITERL